MKSNKIFKVLITIFLLTALLLGTIPAEAASTTVTVFIGEPGEAPSKTNRMYKMIEEQLGIKFEFTFLSGNLDETIGGFMSSGKYPDLIDGGYSTDLLIYAEALIDLLPYISEAETPNLYRHLYTGNRVAQLVDDEGKLYIIPNFGITYNDPIQNENNGPAFFIQKKVIAWNNYVIPTTLDEYFDLLDRYIAANPTDGEGNANRGFEILCDGWRNFALMNPVQHLMGRPNDGIVLVDVNTDAYTTETFINQDYAKGYYKTLNHQYNMGIVAADTFDLDFDTYIESLTSGNVLGMFDQTWNFGLATMQLQNEGRYEDTYLAIPLVYDASYVGGRTIEEHYMNGSGMNINRGFGISKSCRDPGKLVRMFDTLLSDEWQTKLWWGIEGVDYTIDEDGRMVMTDEQYRNLTDPNWRKKNSADALFNAAPKKQGTRDDGNAWSPNEQPEICHQNMSEYDRAFLEACGLDTPGELFNAPIPLAPYGEAWQIDTTEIEDDYSMFLNLQTYMLPGVITCPEDEFETKWAEFIAAITPYAERVSRYLQEAILARVAQNTPDNSCGGSAVWTLENGTLTITGSGVIYNYDSPDDVPWYGSRQGITKIVVGAGISRIGDNAFSGSVNAATVRLPESLKSVGTNAFQGCSGLTDVYYEGEAAEWAKISFGSGNDALFGASLHCEKVHVHREVIDPAVEPTCTEPGRTEGSHCKLCGQVLVEPIILPAGHDWGDVNCTWNEDNTEATATRTCRRDAGHSETETTTEITSAVTKSPTQDKAGTYTYCASFTNPGFPLIFKDEIIPALKDMKTLELPDKLATVEEASFENLGIEAVILPDECTEIEDGAFAGCENIRYVWIPEKLGTLPEGTFADSEGMILDYKTDHDLPKLSVTLDGTSYDYAQSVHVTAALTRKDGSSTGIAAAYPNVRFVATLCTEAGEKVDGFIVQSGYGPGMAVNFPMSSDTMPAGNYKITVETDIPGLAGESPVFRYTADRSNVPDVSGCSIGISLSDSSFGAGEAFRVTAEVRDRNGNPVNGVKVGFMVLDTQRNSTTFYSDDYGWLWNVTRDNGTCSITSFFGSNNTFPAGRYIAYVFLVNNEEVSAERSFLYKGK